MWVTWEGSWTPSETRQDRPNASETLTIIGYEPFIPGRAPGGKIFMYWTARCTTDPWLQGGQCSRFGAYVPDDLREAFPGIDAQSFPRTANLMSLALQQQLVTQYQQLNPKLSMSAGNRQNLQAIIIQQQSSPNITAQSKTLQQPSPVITTVPRQSQAIITPPQTALPKPNPGISNLARAGVFTRGVEEKEVQSSGQPEMDAQSANLETSDVAIIEAGKPELVDPAALTLERPLHVVSANGDAAVLTPGIYEVGTTMDLQLTLAKVGQPTVLVHADLGTHHESIKSSVALLIPGQDEGEEHLVLLISDGTRFDVVGSRSGLTTRSVNRAGALSEKKLKEALIAALAKRNATPPPPCQPNHEATGPRWLPIPCSPQAAQSVPPEGRR